MVTPTLFSRSLALAVILITSGSFAGAATWTDLRGTHSIEADLVGIWDDQDILRKSDGTRISVSLRALRADSRIQAEQLNQALVKHREVRVVEFKGSAAVADAAAPIPLPTPPAPPEYEPPAADMDPAAFLHHVNEQAKAGHHLLVYYDGIPPSYRSAASELFALATSKIDPNQWETLVGTFQDLGELIVTRQNWIFLHPRFAQMPEQAQQRLRDVLIATAGILREGLQSDVASLEKMRSMPLRDWLVEQDRLLAPHLAQLAAQSDDLTQIVVDATQGETATVTISQGSASQKVALTKVEGFWVPTTIATDWEATVASAKETLAAKSNGELLSGGTVSLLAGALQPILAPLREASDAAQFHLAMESTFRSAQPIVAIAASINTSRFRIGGGAISGPGTDGYAMDEYGSPDGYEEMDDYGGSGDPGDQPGYDPSGGPPTNAMEAARAAAAQASQGGSSQGGSSQEAAQRAAQEAAQRAAGGGRP